MQWSLYPNLIHIYLMKFYYEKIFLNTISISQFQKYLLSTFIILKFLKFYIQFIINSMECIMIS